MSDVIVVGAGIVGASCAWRIRQRGASVILLERTAPASGASQAALGVLTFHATVGKPAKLNELHLKSAQIIRDLMHELATLGHKGIYYQEGGDLLLAINNRDLSMLDEEFDLNRRLSVDVELLSPEEVHLLEPAVARSVQAGLYYPDGAWIDNTALNLAIAQSAEMSGVHYRKAHVQEIEVVDGRVRGVQTDQGLLEADWVVVAAGCWSGKLGGVPDIGVLPVRGQAVAVEGQVVRRVVSSPRRYLVPKLGVQTMVGATKEWVGFDDRVTLGGLTELGVGGLEIAPSLAEREIVSTWSGLRPGTRDELPVIGAPESQPNLIFATGHYRNGVVLGPITAELVADMILSGAPAEGMDVFSPDRATLRPGG